MSVADEIGNQGRGQDQSRVGVDGRIVAATDGSVRSHRAVRWAAARAHLHGAGLTIARVLPEHPMPSRAAARQAMREGVEFLAFLKDRARRQLDEAVAVAREGHPDLDVTTLLLTGDSTGTLAGLTRHARLLVVGTTGASGVSGILLGGTAAGVAQHARGPVVVVPEDVGDPGGPVVVGIDDTPAAVDVARVARAEAAASGHGLVVVHTCDVDASIEGLAPSVFSEGGDIARQYETMLAEVVEEIDGTPPVDTETRFFWGRAEHALVRESRSSSLVVVGSRGRGGFAGLLLGSVSRALIAHAHCPTMVVRFPDAPEHEGRDR